MRELFGLFDEMAIMSKLRNLARENAEDAPKGLLGAGSDASESMRSKMAAKVVHRATSRR